MKLMCEYQGGRDTFHVHYLNQLFTIEKCIKTPLNEIRKCITLHPVDIPLGALLFLQISRDLLIYIYSF